MFGYGDGPAGPENWGDLHPEWKLCSSGRAQSPVDIHKKDLQHEANPHRLKFSYKSGSAVLQLRDHDVALEWMEDGGFAYWDEQEYKLRHLHLHTPSEHSINSVRFPLEVHMVHEGPNSKLLVVALQYKYGKEDEFLVEVMKDFPSLVDSGRQDHHVGNVSVSIMKLGEQYYHYMGSLTTPPCTEGVTWIIMKKKRNISKDQVNVILNAELGENARPKQPLNGRTIYKYK